ncbi:MAG: aspartate ammonia-lyase [Chitinophagales bacterium]|nr:aspartate ammonia-lyase [Chitinophagales bacterium]MCZ2393171.1 aspartate ammonia-lyase [Chitinophagales bacterium]
MKTRTESDLLGELQVPINAYYGVQTQRGINTYKISNQPQSSYPEFVKAFGYVKKGAAAANNHYGLFDEKLYKAIIQACDEVIDGKLDNEFPTDMIQGGAGTTMNMNANEVIANRAIEILGFEKGDYSHVSPNDHINGSQSTNDAYPTAIKIAIYLMHQNLLKSMKKTVDAFRAKGVEFASIIKMGRTQLQDAVPMTLGQEFEAFAVAVENEIPKLNFNANLLLEVNMGATAIGTGLNAPKGYAELCTEKLAEFTGLPITLSKNLIEATPDCSGYASYSSALKVLALKVSKISNDLRLLASGPRAGLKEINLPPMAPGSSIMPGKVNPVIPEVVNQTCFKIIGNDLTVAYAAEAGQLQLNVMEPILCLSIMESVRFMGNALDTLVDKCVSGITVDEDSCTTKVKNSIGIVTALNPHIGYKNSTIIAKEALDSGKSVYDLVLEHQLLTKEELDTILDPENML